MLHELDLPVTKRRAGDQTGENASTRTSERVRNLDVTCRLGRRPPKAGKGKAIRRHGKDTEMRCELTDTARPSRRKH
jgi:hypothetical protein